MHTPRRQHRISSPLVERIEGSKNLGSNSSPPYCESMKLLAFAIILLGCIQCSCSADFQVDALVEMKMQLVDKNGVLSDWRSGQMGPCYWDNVQCQDGKVTKVTLSSSGLAGTLSPSIGMLTTLQQLSLEENYISGEIPPELGNLSSLVSLNLGRNDLRGPIPDFFGHLKNLQKLDLSANRLTGNISSTLTRLQSLNYINLADNNLSGDIPVQLLQVAQYDFTGNSFNCGQPSIPCAKRAISTGGKSTGWVVTTIVSLVAVFICFILFFGWIRRQRRGQQSIGYKSKVNVHQELEIEGSSSKFTIFDFCKFWKPQPTNSFSVENKLGQGGFGPVYKGQFPDGLDIAVKRLASHSGQGFREFKNEVQLIAKLQHRNLVRLMGCCSQGEEKMLIYEYLPNKSLDFFIFDETRRSLLNWSKRMKIIEGIAQGLLYLHKNSRLRVIHRDVKASNILLDSEMNPKISDFGLAKMFNSNDTEGSTKRVVGTYGYVAPEYASEGLYSIKSDVFSFGVLVLEIITGKRNSGFHQHEDFLNLLGYAWQLWNDGRWLQLVDASLVLECHQALEMMMRCINIALLCAQENAVDRPSMTDVVAMLSSASMVLPEPNHPAYFHVRVAREEEASAFAEQCSANGVTISSQRGR